MAGYGDYHSGGQSDNRSGGYGQGSSSDYRGGYGHSSDSQERGSRGRGGGGGNRWGGNDGGQKRNFSDHNSANRGGSYSGSGGDRRGNDNHDEEDSSNRMETQRDTIFIQNLPKDVSRDDLQHTFGQIGVIKTDKKVGGPKIWIYKDKVTGDGKGEATITYDDEDAAQAAINWFNDKQVLSNIVKITLATRRVGAGQGGRGRGRGFRGGGGGDRGSYGGDREDRGGDSYESRGRGGGGYRGRGGDRGGFRGGRGGASRGFSRDNRSNPY